MKFLTSMLAAVLVVLVTGCAGVPMKMTEESFTSIESIGMETEVTWNEQSPEYYSAGTNLGHALGGIASMAIADSAASTKEEILAEKMQESGISLAEIARQEFDLQLSASQDLHTKLTNNADAQTRFEVSIVRWGLRAKSAFSAKLKPVFVVSVNLLDSEGNSLWRIISQVTEFNGDTSAHNFGEYLENPQLLEDAFTQAIQITMNKVGQKLVVSN